MKIIGNEESTQDYIGRCPVCSVTGLAKLTDWLFHNYQGYKFAVVIDVYGDEYPVPENPADYTADVLCLDEVFEEAAMYIGLDEAQRMLDKMKERYKR